MAPEISDRDSASAALARVRELAGRLDLDHPDPSYQAGKADQLARAATDLAHDLRVIAEGRRLRRYHDDHRAGVPAGIPHGHDDDEGGIA